MYTYVSSWVKPARDNAPYSNVSLSQLRLGSILKGYLDGYIELTNPGLSKNVFLDLQNLRRDKVPIDLTLTLNGWLASIGSLALSVTVDRPEYSTTRVLSRDAVLADFKVELCEPNKPPEGDASVGNKTNLYVSNPFARGATLQRRVLTTVNGFLHRNYPYRNGVQVTDGGRSMLHAGSNNVGLLSFEHVGDIKQIPIKPEMLNKYTPATPFNNTVMIDLDVNLTNRSIILSLGGYMFVSPSFVNVVSDESGLIEVQLSHIDIPLKLLQSFEYMDLSEVGLVEIDKDNRDFGRIRKSDVVSDIAVKKWLTMSQSFVVVVDTPLLTVEKIPTQKTGIYGCYETHTNPYLPLIDNYGRLQEYWVKQQNDAWVILVADPVYHPHIHDTTKAEDIAFINQIMPYHANYLQPLSFLDIVSTRKL